MSNVSSATASGDQQPPSPTKQRKTRGGKKFDKGSLSESGAPVLATSAPALDPSIDKEMCSLETWLECSSDHLEGRPRPVRLLSTRFAIHLFCRTELFYG